MESTGTFVIGDIPGFEPQIARLVGMLRYARQTTLTAVQGLTIDQLDHLHDERSNSIGMLLAHMAAVEFSYQIETLETRGLSVEEWQRWGSALELGPAARDAIRGEPLATYSSRLEAVRTVTLRLLAARSDAWLREETPFWSGLPANNYFKWFHVMEDEVNHRGQIRWLRQRLPF